MNTKNLLTEKDTDTVESVLTEVFTQEYALYFKTHSYHWNITGAQFYSLHEMLGSQYETLWKSLDEIAERIRVVGRPGPSSIGAVQALPFGSSQNTLLQDLADSHKNMIDLLRKHISTLSEIHDEAGADYLTGLLAEHEKIHWMLIASIAG